MNSPERLRRFLTAEWRHLAMLNYPVERAVLEPLVPKGTVLDTYKGVAYVSVVGFLFLNTRVLGVPVPWHRDFEEVNLRFYVRRFADGGWRRGVAFIKEIVPRPAITAVARSVYNENYVTLPMRHEIRQESNGRGTSVEYGWKIGESWDYLRAETGPEFRESAPGSLEEFITEHYWGYVRQRDGGCAEYQVEHPRWRVATAATVELKCDAEHLYGPSFAGPLSQPPASSFIADGSAVAVFRGQRMAS